MCYRGILSTQTITPAFAAGLERSGKPVRQHALVSIYPRHAAGKYSLSKSVLLSPTACIPVTGSSYPHNHAIGLLGLPVTTAGLNDKTLPLSGFDALFPIVT